MLFLKLTPVFDAWINHNQKTPKLGSPLLPPADSLLLQCDEQGPILPWSRSATSFQCLGVSVPFLRLPKPGFRGRWSLSPGTAVLARGVCAAAAAAGTRPRAGRGAGREAAVKTSFPTPLLLQTAPCPASRCAILARRQLLCSLLIIRAGALGRSTWSARSTSAAARCSYQLDFWGEGGLWGVRTKDSGCHLAFLRLLRVAATMARQLRIIYSVSS